MTVNLNYSGTAPNGTDYSGVVSVTIAAGATNATFTLPTLDDVIADSGETIVVSMGAITGGGFEAIAANPAADTVTTTITDEVPADVTALALWATPSVAEGGTITYTATLNHPAGTPMSVTLSNGATILIAAGATTGTASVAAPTDDVYVDAGSVSVTIDTAAGGNFEQIAINPAPAVTSVTDTINTTTVSLTATPSVAEGGNIVYTASLTAPAQSAVTYLTIELKGSIPESLRPLIGNRIYGCDDCQLVCPSNKFARITNEDDFHVRNGLDDVSLIALFGWDQETFETKLAGTPIRRIGHQQCLRNIAVGLGNAPYSGEIVTALQARLDDASALVREHVQWALQQQDKKRTAT